MLALPRPTALAPLRRAETASAANLPAGSQIAVPTGQIAGALRLLSMDARRMVATYELMVANQTNAPLAAFCYAVGAPQRGGRLRWSSITVPPLSSVAVPVEIELPKRGPLRKIVAELHADGAQLIVDAEPPALRRGFDAGKAALGLAGAGIVALAAGAIAFERPRVAALAAPNRVPSGATFQVAYAFGPGTNAGDYALDGPDGREIARGTLAAQSGVITLAVPSAHAERRYDLHLTGRNAFGSAEQSTAVVAAASAPPKSQPAPKPAAPEVHLPTVWLQQDTVQGGAPIVVRYITDAKTGTVKLLDQDGTERGSALLSERGSSILIAPQVDSQEDFRVVVVARRGDGRSEAQVPVRVVRNDITASGSAGVPDPAGAPAPGGVAGDPVALASKTFISGEGIVVSIVHHQPNLRVVLLDDSGQEIQNVDVAPDDDRVVLEAPRTTTDTRYTIVATYGPGTSEESVIHSVVVRAR
jgi:hypothetical protein